MKITFSLNQCYPFLMRVIFFKAFPGISNVSQNDIKKLFTIIWHQYDGSEIDSKTSNLSYFNMGFFLNHFLIYHIYITKRFNENIYNNKTAIVMDLR